MRLRSSCSLCVAGFFARTTAVNLHLNDENINSTICYVDGMSFQTLRGFSSAARFSALGLNPCSIVPTGTDHRISARVADRRAAPVCIISCIRYYASRTVWIFLIIFWNRQIVRAFQNLHKTIFSFFYISYCTV